MSSSRIPMFNRRIQVQLPLLLPSPWAHTGNSNRYDSDWGTIGKKLGRNYASIYTVFRSDAVWGGFYLGPSHRVAADFSA